MIDSLTFTIPHDLELGNVEIRIQPVSEGKILGTLYISRAGVMWHPKGRWKIKAPKLSWPDLVKLLEEEGP